MAGVKKGEKIQREEEKKVKAHVVCFERGFRPSPGGSSSRMFIWLNDFWNWDFPEKSHRNKKAELEL